YDRRALQDGETPPGRNLRNDFASIRRLAPLFRDLFFCWLPVTSLLLQRSQTRLKHRDSVALLLDGLLLLLDFVQQQRGQEVVADRLSISLRGELHQLRHYLGHFFRNQTVLADAHRVVAVEEGDRAKLHQPRALRANAGDVSLDRRRGGCCPKLPVGIDQDRKTVCHAGGHPPHAREKRSRLGNADADRGRLPRKPIVAYVDIFTAGGEILTRVRPHSDVVVADGVELKRLVAN